MSEYDWKNLSFTAQTGAATFGPIVPRMMTMEIKEISYSNLTNAQVVATLRQIPSGDIRPPSAIILDAQSLAPYSPYSPRIGIRTVQGEAVIEAGTDLGPVRVNLVYRLLYGRS
ncbi:MAG: hypothetical protein QW587_04615 [Candidatus Bathyarchaeia archaeon]